MLSLLPLCQGQYGSQKNNFTSVATVNLACWESSDPRSQVSDLRKTTGSLRRQRQHSMAGNSSCWWRRGATLPSNLQGLYEVRHDGGKLDYASTMKLLKAFNDFRS